MSWKLIHQNGEIYQAEYWVMQGNVLTCFLQRTQMHKYFVLNTAGSERS